jgi:hypothetical protein
MININSNVSVINNEIELHKLDDEWVIVDKNQEKVAIMNETAFFVWSCVKRETQISIQELCCIMSSNYPELDRLEIERDLVEIVNVMVEEQLLYVL